jgi:hypothetical protein
MGTYTHSLVDRDTVTPEEAGRLGEAIVAWLVEQEIIEPRLTDCCLVDPGYPPGRHYMRACGGIEESARAEDHARMSRYSTNGVQVYTKRAAFYNSQGRFGPARCPHCAAERGIDDYYKAGGEWYEGGEGELRCEQCGRSACVTAWEHDDLLHSTLGLVFWQWPDLSDEFLEELSRRTGGHRWTLIFGKL